MEDGFQDGFKIDEELEKN